ncbi:orotate phosphoribosyltransferase [Pneumocystis jirovecii RU7]|uniref:orotate phosphoribosyltransferase n=1 Tax=Pneumocystis jirovecii (strain RU7) TaxID=1408657 RepID=A0A0W4ZRE3_PNEJ7|nr:orotate phosphoribosyltransferase [Pneumocystis jirovecii RU7]KTW30910.1 orotate phosphoribosyltransferase [Pneumocystis jirovecii RU7]
MENYKFNILHSSQKSGALQFGSFSLKSGRQSPYFFNSSFMNTSILLDLLATAFSHIILNMKIEFDVIFGLAYKGIPLGAITAIKLYELDKTKANIEFIYHRKEKKDHGEGGNIVGTSIKEKRVLILDDVITAGTAIKEAIDIIEKEGGKLVGIVEILDRQEKRYNNEASTVEMLRKEYQIPVEAIITSKDIIDYSKKMLNEENTKSIQEYLEKYAAISI